MSNEAASSESTLQVFIETGTDGEGLLCTEGGKRNGKLSFISSRARSTLRNPSLFSNAFFGQLQILLASVGPGDTSAWRQWAWSTVSKEE